MLSKGRTTMEGLSGSGSAAGAAWGLGVRGWVLGLERKDSGQLRSFPR